MLMTPLEKAARAASQAQGAAHMSEMEMVRSTAIARAVLTSLLDPPEEVGRVMCRALAHGTPEDAFNAAIRNMLEGG